MTPSALRKYPKLPVFVVEDHHEVLAHIYRAIGSRHLPFEGIKMVHLDSHPDLQIPNKIKARDIFNLEILSKHLSIENWIVPAILAGHLNHVVWVKPPWADQLPEGQREVTVGEHKNTGTIRINWPDEYYLSDVMYASKEDMINIKKGKIDIVTLNLEILTSKNPTETACMWKNPQKDSSKSLYMDSLSKGTPTRHLEEKDCDKSNKKKKIRTSVEDKETTNYLLDLKDSIEGLSGLENVTLRGAANQSKTCVSDILSNCLKVDSEEVFYILDIDLDFFSTQNPFQMQYTEAQYAILKELYFFEPPVESTNAGFQDCQRKRKVQLEDLEKAIQWNCSKGYWDEDGNFSHRWRKMFDFVSDLKRTSVEALDPELIHMAGQTTCDDEDDLPHHVSSFDEIHQLGMKIKAILAKQPKPTIITIARSSEDDYCPKHQVDCIQEMVLGILAELYGDLEVKLDFSSAEHL